MKFLIFCLSIFLLHSPAYAEEATGAQTIEKSADDNRKHLQTAHDLIKANENEKAISEHLDKIIQSHEAARLSDGRIAYGGRSPEETLANMMMATEQNRDAIDIGPVVPEAYFMKGIALVNLKKLEEAQAAVEAATAMSPFYSPYKSELAYIYQIQGNLEKALALYRTAGEDAGIWSHEDVKNHHLARAWRGEGYILIEQGKLDEAAALYKKCLELNPNDKNAQGELEYIEKLKARK